MALAQPESVSPAGGSAVRASVSTQTRHESESALSAETRTVQPAAGNASAQLCRPAPAGRQSLSFGSRLSASVIGASDSLLCVFRPVEAHQGRVSVDYRFQVDRARPDVLYVGQGVPRLIHLQIYPIMVVSQQQFP